MMYSGIDPRVLGKTLLYSFILVFTSLILEFILYLWFPSLKIMIALFIFGVLYPIVVIKDMIDSLTRNKNDEEY